MFVREMARKVNCNQDIIPELYIRNGDGLFKVNFEAKKLLKVTIKSFEHRVCMG